MWVDLPKKKEEPKLIDYRKYRWHSKLNWVPDLKQMSQSNLDTLLKLDHFFVHHLIDIKNQLPIKERSLQIFGDEKKLDKIIKNKWFEENFSLDDLGCFKIKELFASRTFCNCVNNSVLIIENQATFFSMCKVNEIISTPLYKHIVYGGGLQILKSYWWLFELDSNIELIEYFGDIDPTGILIPYHLFEKIKNEKSSVQIRLAIKLYDRLLKKGYQKFDSKIKPITKLIENILSKFFTDNNIIQMILEMWHAQKRIAQEDLDMETLKSIFMS